jgi:phosphoribosylformylglycinamidine synthase
VGEVDDIRKTVSPALEKIPGSKLLYIDFSKDEFKLGGSSFGQVLNSLGKSTPTVTDAIYFRNAFEAVQQLIQSGLVVAGHDISSGGLITTLLEMCFPVPEVGLNVDVSALGDDLIKILFSENPGVVIQVENESKVIAVLDQLKISYHVIAELTLHREINLISASPIQPSLFNIDDLRKTWFKTSYLLDKVQRPRGHAGLRKENIFKQTLEYKFQKRFDGKFSTYGIDPKRRTPTGLKAAIIREKGVNGDREMAYALYLAGFDVKDVHMTDLVAGREDLSGVNMIVFVGGFSNSDVLGSAKGWAGAFLYNPKAKAALDRFYARADTLSLGVCNGCQLMMELGLVYQDQPSIEKFRLAGYGDHPKMHHNGSGKFESTFINVTVPKNNSVMLSSYAGTRLGVWLAHGEGQFRLPSDQSIYQIAATFSYPEYPGNPNDSDFAVAALCSHDGRHLAIMPHLERSLFAWNWPYYPRERKGDEVSPWFEAFVNAREWVGVQSVSSKR